MGDVDNESVFQRWLTNKPNSAKTAPRIETNMGSGSDFVGFIQLVGVPSIDHYFIYNEVRFLCLYKYK